MTTSLKLQSPTNVESTHDENKEKEKVTSVDQGNRNVCAGRTKIPLGDKLMLPGRTYSGDDNFSFNMRCH